MAAVPAGRSFVATHDPQGAIMRPRTIALAALPVTVAVTGVALAGMPATAHPQAATTTLTLVEQEGSARFIDNPPRHGRRRPPSIGDQLILTGVDFDASGRNRLGRSYLSCTFVGRGAMSCAGTIDLSDGQLTIQGVAHDQKTTVVAVTGGTRRYAGARGTMRVSETGQRETAVITLEP
jgi:hypothetical protein